MEKYFSLKFLAWSAGMLVLGGGIGIYLQSSSSSSSSSELRLGQQEFTNPLLECEVAAEAISASKDDFTLALTSFVDILKQKPDISEVSVYFRDLNNGPIVGVNQDIQFSPASLLKLPIMMTYFSSAESNPELLDQKIEFKKHSQLLPDTQVIPPEQQIHLSQTYTIGQLIEYMIKYSDNEAMALLYDHLPVTEQVDLYTRVGVDSSIISDPTRSLSVKQYSIFFRILFNASYLSIKDSERALKILSESTFTDGLRAGVPTAIPVAHKFGERQFSDNLQQFHDCGIVYYPKHPYLLCIMTRGYATPVLEQAIADVSKFVYEKIDEQYGN